MKLIFVLFLFLGGVFAPAFSQEYTQTIKGRITDRDTKAPLSNVKMVVLNTNPLQGAISDENGYFRVEKVKIGRCDLRFSLNGYDEVNMSQVQVATGKELILTVEMTEKVKELGGVTVKAKSDKDKPLNEMATVSARTFNVEETQRYAASFNDPARIVRGNSARGMLWRVEGIEIPSPNHFSNGEGGSGGGISLLSSQILGSSDFFTGAFPAEYGNALSGVFDIRFRKGNYQKREYAVQVGILGLQS